MLEEQGAAPLRLCKRQFRTDNICQYLSRPLHRAALVDDQPLAHIIQEGVSPTFRPIATPVVYSPKTAPLTVATRIIDQIDIGDR